MTKQEFLTDLQKALTNKISAAEVRNHINYYQEYIEMEVRKGEKEEDVIAKLGNPRLIAKSILSAAAVDEQSVDENDGKGNASNAGMRIKEFIAQKPAWAVVLILILIVLVLGFFLTSVISIFWPVFIPLALGILIVKWWNKNK